MNQRQKANREILNMLLKANEEMGDQRFGQLLVNAGVTIDSTRPGGGTVNEIFYHEESAKTLGRVIEKLNKLGVTCGSSTKTTN